MNPEGIVSCPWEVGLLTDRRLGVFMILRPTIRIPSRESTIRNISTTPLLWKLLVLGRTLLGIVLTSLRVSETVCTRSTI
jgi:hypothetical protein